MKNILVGINFEDELITELVGHAKQFANYSNATIWLLHVAAPDPDFIGYDAGPQFIRDQRATELLNENKLLQQLKEELKVAGIQAESLLVQGPTVDTFISETRKLNIDLLIIGYHPHGYLYNVLFSSTSEELIKRANIPILIVPGKKN